MLSLLLLSLWSAVPVSEAPFDARVTRTRAAPAAPPAKVRFRPEALPVKGQPTVDRGLTAAAEELVAGATRPDARLTPAAVRIALARAGYPGDARFLTASGGAQPPPELMAEVPSGTPVDIGWAWRDRPGGERWWILGWAPRLVSMDPVSRDIALDQGFSFRVDGARDPRLFVGQPDGAVTEVSLADGIARWLDVFHVPGEYRLEVVDGDRVALLFSVFADIPVPAPVTLPGPAPAVDVGSATALARDRLATLRRQAGQAPLGPFAPFERLVVEHANCLAAIGQIVHSSPSCPGVAEQAYRLFQPHARHHEDVAAGDSAEEAWERLLDSPGHRLNLLCPACTHVAVGAAVPPGRPDRVVIVWELLEFPDGAPVLISRPR